MAETTFHWLDYLIFILTLAISTGIGIFFAWRDRNEKNAEDFLLGGRNMGIVPVTLSLSATLLSAVMVLGVPAMVYYEGALYWVILFSNFIVYPLAAHAFLPVYHNLGITSAYEYLEMRFNMLARILGCVTFQIQMTLSMAVGLYAPAMALNQVMDISMLVSILVIGAICTFYTAIGGLKAVMWTDTFQMVIILAGFLAVVIQGTTEVGGFDVVWEKAKNDSRLDMLVFDPNPLEKHTIWTLVVGGALTTLTVYGGNQAMVQRYLSMGSAKKAQIALYLQLPAGIIITTLFVYGGLVLYAKYDIVNNDPLACGDIDLPDQLIPWMVSDVLGDFHGMPGLLLACLFSASLSTVSSGVNAVALVFMADIVQPAYKHVYGHEIREPKATYLSKVIALGSGAVTIGLAFIADLFGPLILQVALSIYGMIGGPLLGLFVCAMFIPMVNSCGAIIGLLVGLSLSSWLSIGSIAWQNDKPPPPPKSCPSRTTGSTSNITTTLTTAMTTNMTTVTTASADGSEDLSGLETFYSLSYLWYSTFAVVVVVVVAVTVSCLTGGTRKKPVDKKLLSPLYHAIASFSRLSTDGSDTDSDDNIPNGKPYVVAGVTPDGMTHSIEYDNPAFLTKM